MSTDPRCAWSGAELAAHLQVKPRNLLTQLAESGIFGPYRAGCCSLPIWANQVATDRL